MDPEIQLLNVTQLNRYHKKNWNSHGKYFKYVTNFHRPLLILGNTYINIDST